MTKKNKPVSKLTAKARSTVVKKAIVPLKKMVKTKPMMAALTGTYEQTDVIRIILDVAGKFNVKTNAKDIKKKRLYDNLDYTDDLFDNLQIELDRYVKSIDGSINITDDDLGDCETVQDVIDVVEGKLNK